MDDPFDLQRFVAAQEPVYDRVCAELRDGQKRSHWMWFIFPQIQGLGHSAMAIRYAIGSRDEALAYLAHGVLGTRLRDCTGLVNAVEGRSILQILGSPDDMKFRSCVTLFGAVAEDNAVFKQALAKYFDGVPDARTLSLLKR